MIFPVLPWPPSGVGKDPACRAGQEQDALLLDPGKPEHETLFEAVDVVYQRVVSRDQFDIVDALLADTALITQRARLIAKAVWERVKRGE